MVALMAAGIAVRYRVNAEWVFGGADSYGYFKLADELRLHHRYALAPAPAPLHFSRLPGYPIFLALVQGDQKADPGWHRLAHAQAWIDVVLTGLLTWWLGRRLGGRAGGLVALGWAMLCPFTAIWPNAALTEVPAMACTTAVFALLVGERRPRLRFFLAGAVAGLGVLFRQDGLAVGAAFVPALLLLRVSWRERALLGTLAIIGLALSFGAWPARNLYRFGKPYATGTFVDRYSNPFFNYTGYHDWMATWSADGATIPRYAFCFYDGTRCAQSARDYPPEAFDGLSEMAAVDKLFDLRRREGVSERVATGFAKIAEERRARAPLRTRLWLPLARTATVWINAHDDILRDPRWRPWLWLYSILEPTFIPMAIVLALGFLAGGVLLLEERRTRAAALILLSAIIARTLVLAWTFYVEPRYTVEVMPAAYALFGGGVAEVIRRARAYRAKRRS